MTVPLKLFFRFAASLFILVDDFNFALRLNSIRAVKKFCDYAATSDVSGIRGTIPMDQLKISYDRSSGPGGQHANTTNSRAHVRFNVQSADWIPSNVRQIFMETYNHRITKDGEFIVRSDRTRVAALNLADCLDKIRSSLRECEVRLEQNLKPLSDEAVEKLERRREYASKKAIEWKRFHSFKKQDRNI